MYTANREGIASVTAKYVHLPIPAASSSLRPARSKPIDIASPIPMKLIA